MTVYVVIEGYYDDWEIVMVTADLMKAETSQKQDFDRRFIEEHEVE